MPDPPPSQTTTLEITGEMAGEYRLLRKLGEGGFGAVYEAEHPLLKRRAAVKVLHQIARMDSDAVLRFVSEAQAASQIRSRHIVDIFSFGKMADGRHFYVMDLLHGEPLDRHLDRQTRLEVPTALQLLRPIVEALDAAHDAGIVHRDLKPQNIFLVWEPGGETVPKLLDFGTAKLIDDSLVQTASGTPIGTPLYMSPEQARGEKVDRRADVYALGVLCHQLLTGQLPLTGSSTLVVMMAHVSMPPPRVSQVSPDLSPELDEPILRMLEKQPGARPSTAGEALAELCRAAERAGHVIPTGMPHLAPPPTPPGGDERQKVSTARSRPSPSGHRQRPRRRRLRWSVLALAVALGGAGTYLATRGNREPPRRPIAGPAPIPAAPPAAAPAAPAPAPAVKAPPSPGPVQVIVNGAPRGARILLDGQPLGDAPGPVAVPFADTPVELTITAPGYEPGRLTVIPRQSLQSTVTLRKRPSPPARPRRSISKDLENPF
jgi:eukaryotic-like serine/threonine-protein kinase